jgi:hypothetical protein
MWHVFEDEERVRDQVYLLDMQVLLRQGPSMARPLQIEYPGTFYHTTGFGIGKRWSTACDRLSHRSPEVYFTEISRILRNRTKIQRK